MSWLQLAKAHVESNKQFHEKIVPNLPAEIQNELSKVQNFSYRWEGNPTKVILSANGKEFDITEWYVPGITIFDVYEHE